MHVLASWVWTVGPRLGTEGRADLSKGADDKCQDLGGLHAQQERGSGSPCLQGGAEISQVYFYKRPSEKRVLLRELLNSRLLADARGSRARGAVNTTPGLARGNGHRRLDPRGTYLSLVIRKEQKEGRERADFCQAVRAPPPFPEKPVLLIPRLWGQFSDLPSERPRRARGTWQPRSRGTSGPQECAWPPGRHVSFAGWGVLTFTHEPPSVML